MSIYEMFDYDGLQRRIGLEPNETWHCGNNPAAEATMNQPDATFNDTTLHYAGRNPKLVGGIALSEDINVNGLLLNHRDLNGTLWLCTDIEGWWTLAPAEIPDTPKPFWDGSLVTTGRYTNRTVTISGLFIPPDPSLVWYNRDAILRAAGIVRGVGLLALCGNETPENQEQVTDETGKMTPNTFYDPPKMSLIQTADAPLVETYNTNGHTRFSLSFRCVNPAKLSVKEKSEVLEIQNTGVVTTRKYHAFALEVGEGGGLTTEYQELARIKDSAKTRSYGEVKAVNPDFLIEDEELYTSATFDPTSYVTSAPSQVQVLHNKGDYFAFPTFVFNRIDGASATYPLTVQNLTTGETLRIQKTVAAGHQLVIDCGMRRVGEISPTASSTSWQFDDRSYLSLASQWITLAPGPNAVLLTMNSSTVKTVPLPTAYWRDTWMG
jgi:hypothetical protein